MSESQGAHCGPASRAAGLVLRVRTDRVVPEEGDVRGLAHTCVPQAWAFSNGQGREQDGTQEVENDVDTCYSARWILTWDTLAFSH